MMRINCYLWMTPALLEYNIWRSRRSESIIMTPGD